MDRRQWLAAAASMSVAGCASVLLAQNGGVRVVRVHTKKFAFVPAEITLRKDEPVVFEFVADDIAMGLRSVELELRADIVPGKVTRLAFTPRKTGTFDFYCDVFCGDGHEEMDGHFIVTG